MKHLNFITNISAYAAIGACLSGADVHVTNWRFWVILLCVVIVQVNEHIR